MMLHEDANHDDNMDFTEFQTAFSKLYSKSKTLNHTFKVKKFSWIINININISITHENHQTFMMLKLEFWISNSESPVFSHHNPHVMMMWCNVTCNAAHSLDGDSSLDGIEMEILKFDMMRENVNWSLNLMRCVYEVWSMKCLILIINWWFDHIPFPFSIYLIPLFHLSYSLHFIHFYSTALHLHLSSDISLIHSVHPFHPFISPFDDDDHIIFTSQHT